MLEIQTQIGVCSPCKQPAFIGTHVGHRCALVDTNFGHQCALVGTYIGHRSALIGTHVGHQCALPGTHLACLEAAMGTRWHPHWASMALVGASLLKKKRLPKATVFQKVKNSA